jgi:hypothetical protein
MVQHPVVEGLEPDADILSIHLALSKALATPEYCVKDQSEASAGRGPATASNVRIRKTNETCANREGLSLDWRSFGNERRRYVRPSREPRLTLGRPSVTAGSTEARWILWPRRLVKQERNGSRDRRLTDRRQN